MIRSVLGNAMGWGGGREFKLDGYLYTCVYCSVLLSVILLDGLHPVPC